MLFYSPFIAVYCITLAGIFGACMGSFLNCMAWRIVHGESVMGRSHCDECGHVLSAIDLFPIFGYIFAKGKCRYCQKQLSAKHLVCEILSALIFISLLIKYDISFQALEWLVFASLLLVSAFADLEGYIIPDRFIVASVIWRILCVFILGEGKAEIIDSLIGSFAVCGVLLLAVILYEKLRKRDAMGGGDIKLLFVCGLFLGWQKNILCLILSCIIGIVFAAVRLVRSEQNGQNEQNCSNGSVPNAEAPFPFGPSIAAGAILTSLFGDMLISAYLGLF